MADTIILSKTASIERCISRIREDYLGFEHLFYQDQMRQDAIILNLQRACELSIDLANHLVKKQGLGVPKDSQSSFVLLAEAEVLSNTVSKQLRKMVAFRNIAVHQYKELDLTIVSQIVEEQLDVFVHFVQLALKYI